MSPSPPRTPNPGVSRTAPTDDTHDRRLLSGVVGQAGAVAVAVTGGAASAAQALVNGRLATGLGTPVTAALVSNGLATVLLLVIAFASPAVRTSLRRVARERLPWWAYLGGVLGAASVAGTALAAPILGVALFTVVSVCGTGVGGLAADRVGLGSSGRLPVSTGRVAGAALAVVAMAVAQIGHSAAHVALAVIVFVLVLGMGRSVQAALNARLATVARNVGAASLVNATVGTTALGLAAGVLATVGALPFAGWPATWWAYLGGVLALVVTGANMIAARSIGVLRTVLAALSGQLVCGIALDALVPSEPMPTGWLLLGSALMVLAVTVSGVTAARDKQTSVGP
ncbi:DMT family transporter [Actinopolymorpha singaporensis]|uniref:Transporter family-2 protein n=1 Tax=Actinopolymorpha singaporensis TaxID=117157 RepID=A0A1H1RTG1_9ACTN|nr:DMT family transporter [Actinopolymorpha singaporensis]SDS38992.1 transporter family-2 protein [Actinopolymorpha singaporensis]